MRTSSIGSVRSTTTRNTTFLRCGRPPPHTRSQASLVSMRSDTHGENASGVAGSDNSAKKRTSSRERSLDADGYTNTIFMPR